MLKLRIRGGYQDHLHILHARLPPPGLITGTTCVNKTSKKESKIQNRQIISFHPMAGGDSQISSDKNISG